MSYNLLPVLNKATCCTLTWKALIFFPQVTRLIRGRPGKREHRDPHLKPANCALAAPTSSVKGSHRAGLVHTRASRGLCKCVVFMSNWTDEAEKPARRIWRTQPEENFCWATHCKLDSVPIWLGCSLFCSLTCPLSCYLFIPERRPSIICRLAGVCSFCWVGISARLP